MGAGFLSYMVVRIVKNYFDTSSKNNINDLFRKDPDKY
jgi:hypothetical protein